MFCFSSHVNSHTIIFLLQKQLNPREKQEILSELRTSDRLRDALDVVEIVLGFLSSGGGKAEKPLGEYIDKTLKMKKRRFSQKVKANSKYPSTLYLVVWLF